MVRPQLVTGASRGLGRSVAPALMSPSAFRRAGDAADRVEQIEAVGHSDTAFAADVVERIAGLHRVGEPVDVTDEVVVLVSPAAALVTGTTIMVDGGRTVR